MCKIANLTNLFIKALSAKIFESPYRFRDAENIINYFLCKWKNVKNMPKKYLLM